LAIWLRQTTDCCVRSSKSQNSRPDQDRKAINAYLQISASIFSANFFEHFALDFELATLLFGVQEVSLLGLTLF
jgi:hypothetical protein